MERTELVKKLELVGRALADGNMVPIFQCFTFHGKEVSAYNDNLGIVAPCKVEEPFAVNGSIFLGLLDNCHADIVDLKLEEHDVFVKNGRSTFKLPYFSEESFLFERPKEKWDVSFPLSQSMLDGLSACLTTASKDVATQPKLVGVAVKATKGGIGLYSCNGDAITRCVIKGTIDSEYVLPSPFCEAVLRIAADTEFKKGTLSLNQEWAKAELDSGYTVYGRMIESEDPFDHESHIKKHMKGAISFVPVPEGLDYALARARVVADPESAKTVLTVEAGRLKLLTETGMGIVRESLGLTGHPEVVAHVSAELVQHSLSLCNEMAILDSVVAYRKGEGLLQIVSNRND